MSETVFNPCTGSTTTLTAHFLSFVFRLDDDPAGGEHYTLTGVVQFSTTDGFSGRGTFHDSGTRYPGQSGIEIDIEVMSQTAGNGTGQRVVVHGVVQRVRRDGVPVVYFENFSLECVGKPVA